MRAALLLLVVVVLGGLLLLYGPRAFLPGDSEEESLCLAVIAHVERALESSPGEQAAWAARLRSQLKLHQERGTLRLPVRGGVEPSARSSGMSPPQSYRSAPPAPHSS